MKTILLTIIFCFCAALSTRALEYQYANCTGTIYDDKLEVQIKLYNIVTNEIFIEEDSYYDFMRSVYIPISDWGLTGSKDDFLVDGWELWQHLFINTIAYTSYSYDVIIEPWNSFSIDIMAITMDYVPIFAELKARDSLIIDISFDLNDSIYSNLMNSSFIHIKIPYIKNQAMSEINEYRDISEVLSESNYFSFQINPSRQPERNYSLFSKIKTDKALIRLLRVAIIENFLTCNCRLRKISNKEKR